MAGESVYPATSSRVPKGSRVHRSALGASLVVAPLVISDHFELLIAVSAVAAL
jgi:hypothetical protein